MKTKTSSNALVNQFFHSVNKDSFEIEWQGVVIGNPEPGWYLIQLYGWLDGSPNVQRLIRIEDMREWLFYTDIGGMRYSYDHGVARLGGKYRPQKA